MKDNTDRLNGLYINFDEAVINKNYIEARNILALIDTLKYQIQFDNDVAKTN